jgi:cytochrome bd ubiquinol oxidase subunit II
MELQPIWFFLWGLLWAVYFMTDGFDLGIGTLFPFLGKSNEDKRIMLNAMGPLWDGNEVWLITAGGVTFAAFPLVYAVMFSSLYSALMIILFALIFRGVAFELRGKITGPAWQNFWDLAMFLGSAIPGLLFGVAFANIFRGIPFDGQGVYHGSLFSLLNPYGLLGGVLFLLLFICHGALWLVIKTEGDLQRRARELAGRIWPVVVLVAVLFLAASAWSTSLYKNYLQHPILFLVPLAAVIGLIGLRICLAWGFAWSAWAFSALAIVGATFFGVVGLYPALFPSSLDPSFTLTIYNAASSSLTLKIMLVVVFLFLPVVLWYQVWTYKLFKGKVTEADLSAEEAY